MIPEQHHGRAAPPSPPWRDGRSWVRGTARGLIVLGLLVLGFVVYQLWGTGIEHARAQSQLEAEFNRQLASIAPRTANPVPAPSTAPVISALPHATRALTVPSIAWPGITWLEVTWPATTAPAITPATTVPPTTALPTTAPPTTLAPTTAPPTTVPPTPTTAPPPPPTEPPPPPPPPPTAPPRPDFAEGDPVARLEIARIDLDEIVVAGVGVEDLKKGPGHYLQTPLPGEPGNVAIAGHRTTYGGPFFDIDALEPGDEVVATTYAGRFVYRVTDTVVVDPSDVSVIAATPDDRLTLTSCDPKYSAQNRIVVTAALDQTASSPMVLPTPPPTAPPPPPSEAPTAPPPPPSEPPVASTAAPTPTTAAPVTSAAAPTTAVATTAVPTSAAVVATTVAPAATTPVAPAALAEDPVLAADDSFEHGWFDDAAAWPQVFAWGALLAAVALAGWWLGRRVSHAWFGWLTVALPVLALLYFFYENVNRLLPPNI